MDVLLTSRDCTGIGLLVFLVRYPQGNGALNYANAVGIWRRFGAFFLDTIAIWSIGSPLAALPPLIAEARFLPPFRWSFERNFDRPDDWFYMLCGVVPLFVGMFWYFYHHSRAGRQTFGQYLMGYRTIADPACSEGPAWALRVIMSFGGLCMWPISVFLALRDPRKAFWWDTEYGATAVRVAPVHRSE